MDIEDIFLNQDYMATMFSDCVDSGASLLKDGPSYLLKFPQGTTAEGPRASFSLLDDSIEILSNIDGFDGTLPLDEFMASLDALSAKMLSEFDGVDRGV